jgi:hypothetical protein
MRTYVPALCQPRLIEILRSIAKLFDSLKRNLMACDLPKAHTGTITIVRWAGAYHASIELLYLTRQ